MTDAPIEQLEPDHVTQFPPKLLKIRMPTRNSPLGAVKPKEPVEQTTEFCCTMIPSADSERKVVDALLWLLSLPRKQKGKQAA